MRFWLEIALASSAHPQEQINSTQECLTSSQKNLELTNDSSYVQWRCTSHYVRRITKSILINLCFSSAKPNCLTVLMHLLPGQLGTAIYLIKQTAISPLTRNSTISCTYLVCPKRPAQLSYGLSLILSRHQQVVAMLLFQLH